MFQITDDAVRYAWGINIGITIALAVAFLLVFIIRRCK